MNESRCSFGAMVGIYDRVRPDYHVWSISDIIRFIDLKSNDPVLEVGCGSGQATQLLVDRGLLNIDAIDISEPLIALAQKKIDDGARFIVGAFETAELPQSQYKLLLFALSFHWIDRAVRCQRIHSLLTDDGHVAIINNYHLFSESETERRVFELYRQLCPEFPKEYEDEIKLRSELLELGKNNLTSEYYRKYPPRTLTYTRDDYRALQQSFSWVNTLEKYYQRIFFQELDRIIGDQATLSIPWETVLLIAKKSA